jgi:hypothetical protein
MENEAVQKQAGMPSSRKARAGAGNFGDFLDGAQSAVHPYLPADLVGGSIPYIPGTEDEAVWNAASQSCGTERVHYCYTVNEGRIWYLAAPSASLASSPDSWCPLAAALPGNSEFWDRETIYLYEQEGAAGALRWDAETGRMQVFLGAARTILPRIQSMEANFVTINPEVAKTVFWKNRALRQEKLSRVTVKLLLVSGLIVTFISLFVLVGAYLTASVISPQLAEAKKVTSEATNQLMIQATNALQSNVSKHLSRIIELFNTIGSFGGILVKYEVKPDGAIVWEALIPSAVDASQLKATAVGAEKGRIRIRGTT